VSLDDAFYTACGEDLEAALEALGAAAYRYGCRPTPGREADLCLAAQHLYDCWAGWRPFCGSGCAVAEAAAAHAWDDADLALFGAACASAEVAARTGSPAAWAVLLAFALHYRQAPRED
jgi:hypothetical protein